MHRRHDPTYYWATRRLPAEIRPATHALYGYVRTADEIVDGPRRPAERRGAPRRARRLGARAAARPGRRAARRTRSSARSSTPARRHRLPLGELRHLHALDADRLRAGADRDLARSSRPTWTARPAPSAGSWRRCSACPSATTPGYGRLGQAFQLANFIRDVREDTRARPHLPAGRGPRALRRRGGATWRAARVARAARAARLRGPPRARAVRRGRAGGRRRARVRPHRRPLRRRASTCACSTASSGSTSTCSAAAPPCGRGSCPGRRVGALRR